MGYRAYIAWIANNDDEDIGNADTGYIVTICMVADVCRVPVDKVARAVLAYRKRNQ